MAYQTFSPEDFFDPWESTITGWDSALENISRLHGWLSPERTLVWRGLSKASYSLHSSLYRAIRDRGNNTPEEDVLLKNEKRILHEARKHWRFDQMPALELLAHLQHYGAPTRLLDVSMSPLVALWFAVEHKRESNGAFKEDEDGRLFAFDVTDRDINLDSPWGGYALPWEKKPPGWQKESPYVWRPPSYHDRIPAQNSAFLISGVPLVSTGKNAQYRRAPGDGTSNGTWSAIEVRSATSVNIKMTAADRQPQKKPGSTFTFRVNGSAKDEIRRKLKLTAGLDAAAIYPDIFGLADHGAPWVIKP